MKAKIEAGSFHWSLILATFVLAAALLVQTLHVFRKTSHVSKLPLAESIPHNIPEWTAKNVPLGANEFLSNEVEKVLNYDEVVNREFVKDGSTFSIYAAYWGAGKMPTRMVASHTPDRCWTENGWRCLEMKFRQTKMFEGKPLLPAEWRVFEPPSGGGRTYVMYWHLVEGRIYDYGERFNNIPDPMLWWKDALQQALQGSREQYFIRLTSNQPLENLWSDPGFQEVLRGLGNLGLVKNPQLAMQK